MPACKSWGKIALTSTLWVACLIGIVSYLEDTDPSYFETAAPAPTDCSGSCYAPNNSCPVAAATLLGSHRTIGDVLSGTTNGANSNLIFTGVFLLGCFVLWLFLLIHDISSLYNKRPFMWVPFHLRGACSYFGKILKGPFGIALAGAACYKERWAYKACCSCEEFGKWPFFTATAFLAKHGKEFASWTGRTLWTILGACAPKTGGALADDGAGGGSTECHATMIPMFFVAMPIGALLGAANLAYWAALVLPIALIGSLGAILFVFLLAPMFPGFLFLLAVLVDFFLIFGFPFVLIVAVIILTVRHPISMALYNVIWSMVLMLALLALIFVDTFVQLGGDSAGLLLYASLDTRQSASCICKCLYQIAKPKMYILLGVTAVAIVKICNHLGRGCKNLTRGNRNHTLITINYKIPIVIAAKLNPNDPAAGISEPLLTQLSIPIDDPLEAMAAHESEANEMADLVHGGRKDTHRAPSHTTSSAPASPNPPPSHSGSSVSNFASQPPPPPAPPMSGGHDAPEAPPFDAPAMDDNSGGAPFDAPPVDDDSSYHQPPPPPPPPMSSSSSIPRAPPPPPPSGGGEYASGDEADTGAAPFDAPPM